MAKAAADGAAPSGKVFSADVVAALLMSFNATTVTKQQYELMSAMDGGKTASAFQHDFRSVLAKARELKTRVDNGEKFEAVQPGKKRSAAAAVDDMTPPSTPKKQKAAPKPKATPKPRGKKCKGGDSEASSVSPSNEFSDGFGGIIKNEDKWDEI